MSLQRDARYPGRWTAASGGHPQGAFKNRTAPGSLDGSYIEQDWANDWDGYFSSLLSAAGLTANGNVDAVGASQYFDALNTLLSRVSPIPGESRNLICSITAANAVATFTADYVTVLESSTGKTYRRSAFNKTADISGTGVGKMDTGLAPVSGYVATYAIYNPTTNTDATLSIDATAAAAPLTYAGAFMPAGYTASALISVLPTDASRLFKVAYVSGRKMTVADVVALNTSAGLTLSLTSIASAVPRNAIRVSGTLAAASTSGSGGVSTTIAGFSSGLGSQSTAGYSTSPNGCDTVFRDIPLATVQTIWVTTALAGPGTGLFTIKVREYEI